jgi:hypothetical protein
MKAESKEIESKGTSNREECTVIKEARVLRGLYSQEIFFCLEGHIAN